MIPVVLNMTLTLFYQFEICFVQFQKVIFLTNFMAPAWLHSVFPVDVTTNSPHGQTIQPTSELQLRLYRLQSAG